MVAWRTRGKDTSIRSVVSGVVNRTRPPAPMLACRVPSGLVTFTVSGVDGRPAAGRTISDAMRRRPCQLRWMTGLGVSAVHGMPADPLIRLAGNPAGCAPGVEATLTCSRPGAGGPARASSASSSASSPGPGRASAEACSRRAAGRATVNARAMGGVAAGSAYANGDGTCWWKEKTAAAACWPAGSSAGWSRRVTRTPGISTSDIPAPGLPRTTRPAPAIVMRSQRVRPGTTFSGWTAPVAATRVVTLPAAVDTRSTLAISRSVLSSSRRIPTRAGRSSGPEKVIWIHCPTGVRSLPSAQDVAGLPSKALTGSSCWVSAIQEP